MILYGKTENGTKKWKAYDSSTNNYVELFDDSLTTDVLIQYLKVGDILTYSGHTMIVYDLMYDGEGNAVNAKVMESGHGGGGYNALSKISKLTKIGDSIKFGSPNYLLYINSRQNDEFADSREEGSIHLSTVKDVSVWKNLANSNKEEYSVLRFITEENGQAILTYHGANYSDTDYDSIAVELPQKTLDRLKFDKLYIEKTVNVFAGSAVKIGDEIIYKIIIQNNSDSDYTENIHVYENISPYVNYEMYEANKDAVTLQEHTSSNLTWDIGRIASGEEVVIEYKVVVKADSSGKTIKSTGMVESIPSAVIQNPVQRGLTSAQSHEIVTRYDNLKDSFNGKELINEVYRAVLGKDLGIDDFDIENLIDNPNSTSSAADTIKLNDENPFFGAVFNQYWNALFRKKYNYNNEDIYSFRMKLWSKYGETTKQRADTIFSDNFETGDVLIYKNSDDNTYQYDSETDSIIKTSVTYENGEYAYIFIKGRGFVGVNYGADRVAGTDDDRINFDLRYYEDNGLNVYSKTNETDTEFLSFVNLQTLFGKDYYVILRPSMIFNSSSDDEIPPDTSDDEVPSGNDNEDQNKDIPANGETNDETDDEKMPIPNTGSFNGIDKGNAKVNIDAFVSCFVIVISTVGLFIYSIIKRIKLNKKF